MREDCPHCGQRLHALPQIGGPTKYKCSECECEFSTDYPGDFGVPGGPICPVCKMVCFQARKDHLGKDGKRGIVFAHTCYIGDDKKVHQGGHFVAYDDQRVGFKDFNVVPRRF